MANLTSYYSRTGSLGNQNLYAGGYVIDDVAIPAGTLLNNGDALDIEVVFRTAFNGASGKRFNLYVLGTVVYDSGSWAGNGHASYLKCRVIRTSATKASVFGFVKSDSAAREQIIDATVTADNSLDTGQNKLQMVAIGTSNLNDMYVKMTTVDKVPV